jgi:hypothetical protein
MRVPDLSIFLSAPVTFASRNGWLGQRKLAVDSRS